MVVVLVSPAKKRAGELVRPADRPVASVGLASGGAKNAACAPCYGRLSWVVLLGIVAFWILRNIPYYPFVLLGG